MIHTSTITYYYIHTSNITKHSSPHFHKVSLKELKVPRMHAHVSDDLMVAEVVQCEWNHDNILDNLTSLN